MPSRFEIALSEINNELISLNSLSAEALDSFIAVVSSLKSIAAGIGQVDNLVFTIREGSALCAVEAPDETITAIYNELDQALKGESEDKEFTGHLRRIQEQVCRSNFKYRFVYKRPSGQDINIHPRLLDSSRIAVKRSRKNPTYRVRILVGFLNQIGGKVPNYHFDYGHGETKKISCTEDEAKVINKFLYQTVNALVICKEPGNPEKPTDYVHKMILNQSQADGLRGFLFDYNREPDLINKLSLIHEFVDRIFSASNPDFDLLKILLIGFNDRNLHLSELKTLLVISKPVADALAIKDVRTSLLETYHSKRGQ